MNKIFILLTFISITSLFGSDFVKQQSNLLALADEEIRIINEFKECVKDIDVNDSIYEIEIGYCLKNKESAFNYAFEEFLNERRLEPWDPNSFIKLKNPHKYCLPCKCSCEGVVI